MSTFSLQARTFSLAEARRSAAGRLVDTRVGTLHAIVEEAVAVNEGDAHARALPLVMLHGVTDNAHTWASLRRVLPTSWQTHALDLPAHGLSFVPARGNTLHDHADAVLAYLDAARLSRVVLIGNSMGGGVTLALASRAPDRVAGAVTLGGIGLPMAMPRGLRLLRKGRLAERMALAARSPTWRRLLVRDSFAPGFKPPESWLQGYWRAWRVTERAAAMRDQLAMLAPELITSELPHLRVPLHVVHGELDHLVPTFIGRGIVSLVPGARGSFPAGVGHMPQVECVDLVADVLREMMARVA